MQEHQKRVVTEKEELSVKAVALSEFMHGNIYASLPAVEQGLLMVQLVAMRNYESALERRIDLFD